MAVVRRWHWGKVALIWAWGGLLLALMLADFLSRPVGEALFAASFTFIGSILILIALSALTWIWLGGKDRSA
jgi:hypothetical protein